MKIETVTVCINFSEYFSQCISNKEKLDRWVIVTHKDDSDTIKLCKDNKLEYILSKDIYKNGAAFAKGKAINEALNILNKDDWILHLDGDIQLPDDFREIIEDKASDTNNLYWIPRYCSEDGKLKLMPHNKRGRCEGYFQLWHSSTITEYPAISKSAKFDDIMMGEYFKIGGPELSIEKIEDIKLIDVSGVRNQFHYGVK